MNKVYKYNGVNKVVKDDNGGKEQVIIFCSKGDSLSSEQGRRMANVVCAMMNDINLLDEVEHLILKR